MPHKHYFDEPVVRFDSTRSRFPRVCAVCGGPATKRIPLTIVGGGRRRYLSAWWDPTYSRPSRIMSQPTKIITLPVCDDHVLGTQDYCRLRLLCLIGTAFMAALGWMAFFVIGDSLWRGQMPPVWALLAMAGLLIAIALSIYSFRPKGVERAVRIVGFDPSLTHIIAHFTSREFRDRFLQENPNTAELINWIIVA